MDIEIDFRVEGRVIRIEYGEQLVADVFFPYTREAVDSIHKGSFLLAESVRSEPSNRRFVLMTVTEYEIFHSGLTDLDPMRVPFPSAVIDVSKRVYEELLQGAGSKLRLAGIRVRCLLTGHEVFKGTGSISKTGEKPLLGSQIWRPSPDLLDHLFNGELSSDATAISVGAYQTGTESIRILLNTEKMVRHHVGVFGSTGAGKSFLISNIVARSLAKGVRHVIFDIAPEFPALLIDVIYKYACKYDDGFKTAVVARKFEDIKQVGNLDSFEAVAALFNVPDDLRSRYRSRIVETFHQSSSILDPVPKIMLPLLTTEEIGRTIRDLMAMKRFPQAEQIARDLSDTLRNDFPGAVFCFNTNRISPFIPECRSMQDVLQPIQADRDSINDPRDTTYKFLDGIYRTLDSMANRRDAELGRYLDEIRVQHVRSEQVIGPQEIVRPCLEGESKLQIVLSDTDESTQDLISNSIATAFEIQRRAVDRRNLVFVVDEAHNFASNDPTLSSWAIERLAREGRKNHLGLLLASQRCAYMNSSVMAQLKTYFFSNLKLKVDRDRIASTFAVSSQILDTSVSLGSRDWYLASDVATGLRGTPILLEADDVIRRIEEECNWG